MASVRCESTRSPSGDSPSAGKRCRPGRVQWLPEPRYAFAGSGAPCECPARETPRRTLPGRSKLIRLRAPAGDGPVMGLTVAAGARWSGTWALGIARGPFAGWGSPASILTGWGAPVCPLPVAVSCPDLAHVSCSVRTLSWLRHVALSRRSVRNRNSPKMVGGVFPSY